MCWLWIVHKVAVEALLRASGTSEGSTAKECSHIHSWDYYRVQFLEVYWTTELSLEQPTVRELTQQNRQE